ncbi:hypothetical protein B0H14DRAFT_92684 [Mycena olivaceomarginata]|nr:hypothetical protein B0H14DRAFT_92684 [Mycena olivaceomarginata]
MRPPEGDMQILRPRGRPNTGMDEMNREPTLPIYYFKQSGRKRSNSYILGKGDFPSTRPGGIPRSRSVIPPYHFVSARPSPRLYWIFDPRTRGQAHPLEWPNGPMWILPDSSRRMLSTSMPRISAVLSKGEYCFLALVGRTSFEPGHGRPAFSISVTREGESCRPMKRSTHLAMCRRSRAVSRGSTHLPAQAPIQSVPIGFARERPPVIITSSAIPTSYCAGQERSRKLLSGPGIGRPAHHSCG